MKKQFEQAFNRFMKIRGEKFQIIREGIVISEVDGLSNHENNDRAYIGFYPSTDIKPNDWVKSIASREEFFIEDIGSHVIEGSVMQIKGYYLTSVEHARKNAETVSNPSFVIHNAHNSIIGTQATASIINEINYGDLYNEIREKGGEDADRLIEMIEVLRETLSKSEGVKKGVLSKFSGLMQKHSWITGTIAKLTLDWLMKSL